MRRVLRLAVLCLAIVACTLGQNAVPNFKVDVPLVSLDVGVTDSSNRPLTDLTKDDFLIYEDGDSREVKHFSAVETPYNILALFDCTGSTRESWPFLLQSLNNFLRTLRPQDRIAVAAFGRPTSTILDWTARSSTGNFDIQMQMPSPLCDQTDFYGAVEWAVSKLRRVDGRKGVIFFTDGVHSGIPSRTVRVGGVSVARFVDPGRDPDFLDARSAVERSEAVFYFIAVNTDLAPSNVDASGLFPGTQYTALSLYNLQQVRSRMEQLVQVSGGGIVYSQRTSDTGALFEQVAHELGTSYSLGFTPSSTLDGTYHRIEIRLRDAGMKVRQSRDGYYAR
jgi:VWFA-related protein